MKFRGNSAILHCFQITPHRGQWRTKVVGNIGDQSLLIVFTLSNLACHIRQGGSQITNLIFAVYLKFIAEVTDCVLLCGMCDLAQWQIDHLCEKEQNNQ